MYDIRSTSCRLCRLSTPDKKTNGELHTCAQAKRSVLPRNIKNGGENDGADQRLEINILDQEVFCFSVGECDGQDIELNEFVLRILVKESICSFQKEFQFYVWREIDKNFVEVRWMTSFDTTKEDIEDFVAVLSKNSSPS